MNTAQAALAAGLLVLTHSPPSAADAGPQAVALNCLTCHSHAESTGIPKLTGLSAAQMTLILLDFKYDRKSATLMPRIAKGYNDAELAGVAAYLTALRP
ncbi:cytochrome c [Methylomonas sp. HYX-M1]|uniref:c-type cytochrome n=1 Tax=Methylomonas sp. HYX-M1 TaxID=3139307 RepID=UPI00345C36FB